MAKYTVNRAAEWRHKDVELAAHRLLQELDKAHPGASEDRAGLLDGRG
jgi:hypothetical protein